MIVDLPTSCRVARTGSFLRFTKHIESKGKLPFDQRDILTVTLIAAVPKKAACFESKFARYSYFFPLFCDTLAGKQ